MLLCFISPYAGNIYKSQRWEHENYTFSLYSTWTTAVSESHSTVQMHESSKQQIINVYCAFNSGNHLTSCRAWSKKLQCKWPSRHSYRLEQICTHPQAEYRRRAPTKCPPDNLHHHCSHCFLWRKQTNKQNTISTKLNVLASKCILHNGPQIFVIYILNVAVSIQVKKAHILI